MSWTLLAALFVVAVALIFARRRREPTDLDEDAAPEVEDFIDLHGFQPRDIPSVVESYLEVAAREGYREVRLIHGRGKGVQRQRVQALLANHPLVERFGDAPAHRGGWGATIATLRRPEERPEEG